MATSKNAVGALLASTYYQTSVVDTVRNTHDVALVETAIPLTITSAVTANKVYDGNTTAAVSGATLSGVVSGDNVTLAPVYNFSQSTPGTSLAITSTSTITGTNAGAYTLSQPTLTARNITAGTVGQWLGVVSTSYTNVANWQSYSVPTASSNIIIPTGTTYLPILAADTTVNNLSIASGTTLGLGGNKLTINGAVSGTGTISGSATSSLTIGSTAGIIYLTPASNTIKNLTLNNSSSVTLGNAMNITAGASAGIVTIGSGATLTTGGNLNIKSDINGSARIAQSAGSISGNVTVERYIPAKTARKYSFIGSAVGGVSIQNSWQKNIYITGSGSGGTACGTTTANGTVSTDKYNTNGFDVTQNNSPSMYYYGANTASTGSHWTSVATTYADNLSLGKGYRVNIRGDRTQGTCSDQLASAYPTAPVAVTLSATGTVGAGNVAVDLTTKTNSTNLYSLIANPYPCPIDFDALCLDNADASTGISGNMWLLSTDTSKHGNYTTYSNGTAVNAPIGEVSVNNLESGQAFFVQSSSSAAQTVTFKESHKIVSTPSHSKFFGTNAVKLIRVGFTNPADSRLDEIVVKFTPNGTTDVNASDAVSFGGGSQTIAVLKGTNKFAVAYFPDTLSVDTVALGISSTTSGNFKLAFSEFAGIDSTQSIVLYDKYLSVNQDIRANPTYAFNITSDTGSKGNYRFALLFTKGTTLPVSFTNVNATAIDKGVAIRWNVANEMNIASYKVERGIDAKNFVSIATVKATNSSSYMTQDTLLPEDASTLYYRIKAINTDGTVIYSTTTKLIKDNSSLITLSVYPNPVQDKLNITMTSGNTSTYKLRIMTLTGKEAINKAEVKANNSMITIPVSNFAAGVYLLELTDSQGNKQIKKFVKE